MTTITLPYNWTPRDYQRPVFRWFENGGRFAATVWARRHGKDLTAMNRTACAAHERIGSYWHMFPQLKQARRAIWDGIDENTGIRFIDQAFPKEIRADHGYSDQEMKIKFKCGSTWQLVGADNYDALVGANPVGVVLSEWSLMDPQAYQFISPILTNNKGWAWFIYTPRGKNHGFKTYERALQNPEWFAEIVTIETAGVHDVAEIIAEERANGKPEELIQQEYFCSFESGNVGTVFRYEIDRLRKENRIQNVPYDPNWPVQTAWDIGVRDKTSIWYLQKVNGQTRFIDYDEGTGKSLAYWAGVIHAKPYSYIRHIAPHDMKQREFASNSTGEAKSRLEIASENFGIDFEVAPKLSLEDSINAARSVLATSVFDELSTEEGFNALDNYAYKLDEEANVFSKEPKHDWASHAAAALRTYAVMEDVIETVAPWMQDLIKTKYKKQYGNVGSRIGHNGGPPLDDSDSMADYDPLAEYR